MALPETTVMGTFKGRRRPTSPGLVSLEGTALDGREAMLRAGRVVICLQAHRANDGSTFTSTRTGLDHLAFHLSTHHQLEAWDRHVSDLDVAHSPIKQADRFGSMIELRDPDNTQIELFAPA